jgi:hypothetical protein
MAWIARSVICVAFALTVSTAACRLAVAQQVLDAADWADPWLAEPLFEDQLAWPESISPAYDPVLINPVAASWKPLVDDAVQAAQASQPMGMPQLPAPRQVRRIPASLQRPAPLATAGFITGTLASVPYMIGDTGAGTCVGFDGLLDAELSHPTLACGRLNIAENNSPLPANRFYVSYRHFHNASPISVYQFREAYDIDRWTLATERTFFDGMASWEIRLPLAYQVKNDIISIFDEVSGAADLVADPNREAAVGNLSMIFKFLLIERSDFALSAGLGVTVPTARDVRYRVGFRGEVLYTDFPDFSVDSLTTVDAHFENETVYLQPFMSWLYAPRGERWFHQGFLQVEAAANPSTVTADATGLNLFLFQGTPIGFFDYSTLGPVPVDLHAQTLLRLNLGAGYELARNPHATFVQRLLGLAELHYTHTLNDANLSLIPTTSFSGGLVLADFQELKVGNLANRVDILNAALGVQANMGQFVVTNGFVAPIRTAPDRGFDFEYNLQIQRPY